jgi:RND superfamily putative drug exporter
VFSAIGRLCLRHRRAVAAAWLLVLVLGVTVGSQVFSRLSPSAAAAGMESIQGFELLEETADYGGQLVALVDGPQVQDPAVRAAVITAAYDVRDIEDVGRVVTAYDTEQPGLVATDGAASLVQVDLRPELADTETDAAVDAARDRLAALEQQLAGADVGFGGGVLLNREINEQVKEDTLFAEVIAIPAALVVMVLIFRGFVAAGIPLLGALGSIAGALLALYAYSFAVELDSNVPSVTTILGLGLAIDYALLMVSRFREERALGRSVEDAVVVMSATAGRTITFSALTVATSLSGLSVFSSQIYRDIGAAGVVIVLLSLAAALTLTPAMLGFLGKRVRPGRESLRDEGFFSQLARQVQRRPLAVVLGTGALLVAAAMPVLSINLQNGGPELLPRSFDSRQVAETVAERFPGGGVDPVIVVAETDADTLTAYADRLAGRADVAAVSPAVARGEDLSVVEVIPAGGSAQGAAGDLVREVRAEDPGFTTYVTGAEALLVDFTEEIRDRGPWAVLTIALATFVLLFLMTGSVLVPLKAIVMNVLSLGATFGVVVWIFQYGNLEGLLGFDSSGGLEAWVPVIVFAFAFGVSMDYEVFLLSRVKELHDAGLPNDRAVEVGLQRSGRIITSAALLVLIVFAGFAAGQMLGIKELGTALFVAVLIDATLVRCLLVPATMTLLGDLNWWAPGPLRRLHERIGLREHVDVPPPTARERSLAGAEP